MWAITSHPFPKLHHPGFIDCWSAAGWHPKLHIPSLSITQYPRDWGHHHTILATLKQHGTGPTLWVSNTYLLWARSACLLHVAAYIRSYTKLLLISGLLDLSDWAIMNEWLLRGGPHWTDGWRGCVDYRSSRIGIDWLNWLIHFITSSEMGAPTDNSPISNIGVPAKPHLPG